MSTNKTRQARWRSANPQKYDAHKAVCKAMRSGKLEKQHCEVCGASHVDAHHDNYDKPLNVRWLCRRHHIQLHFYGADMFPLKGKASEAG
ncbi:hypothetical protein DWB67_14640 [Paracoccus sp. JM45]|nr:hypothetical protein DWB67_14640 [Paracoccus sp. JM45]